MTEPSFIADNDLFVSFLNNFLLFLWMNKIENQK